MNTLGEKMGKWKKRIVGLVIFVILALVIVSAIQFGMAYVADRRYEEKQEAYNRLIPSEIQDYPELKREAESNSTEYDLLMRDSQYFSILFDPYYFKPKASAAVLNCRIRLNEIDDFKKDGLNSFNDELDLDQYSDIGRFQEVFLSIPSISEKYKEYSSDKIITYKEYCTLTTMLNLWVNYKNELTHKEMKDDIKNNL